MLDKEEDIKRNLKVEFEKKLKKTEDDFNTIINSINSSLEKSDNRATELKKELDFNKETLKKLEKEVIEQKDKNISMFKQITEYRNELKQLKSNNLKRNFD